MAELKTPISGNVLTAATWLKNYNKAMGDYYGAQRRFGQAPDENYFEKQLGGGMTIYRPIQPSTHQEAECILAALGISSETQPNSFRHALAASEGPMTELKPTMDDWFAKRGWVTRTGKPRATRNGWTDAQTRVEAIKFLVLDVLKKNPRDITADDFHYNCLAGLTIGYYADSPYAALKEAGLANFHEWEMSKTTQGFWNSKENRIRATNWLVTEKLNKDRQDITRDDFISNGLYGLINHYSGTPHAALKEAGLATFNEWELARTPKGVYDSKETRVAAVKWLIKKLGKDPRNITYDDFHSNRLGGLLAEYHSDSPYAALKEAELANFHPWELLVSPNGTWNSEKTRSEAARWLVKKLGKNARDITHEDFFTNGLSGLLDRCSGSPYKVLKEAGLVTNADEAHMRSYANKNRYGAPNPE